MICVTLLSLLFLSTTVAGDGTGVGANSPKSNTRTEYSQLEKARLVGQALLDNDHLFRELEAIYFAYADFKKTQPPSQIGGVFSEVVLGMMPKLLSSREFQDIARNITDEVGRVNISKVTEMTKANDVDAKYNNSNNKKENIQLAKARFVGQALLDNDDLFRELEAIFNAYVDFKKTQSPSQIGGVFPEVVLGMMQKLLRSREFQVISQIITNEVGRVNISKVSEMTKANVDAKYHNPTSYIKKEYSQLEKARLVGQALLDNDHVFRELEAIYFAYADFKKTQPPSQIGEIISEVVLGIMPKLLRNREFQASARNITDEFNRFNTADVTEMSEADDGTDVGANYNNSNTKKEYSQLEKARLVGQALLDNDHVFRELEAIFYAYAEFKKTQPPSQIGGVFSEVVLGMMPKLFRSREFQDISQIITDEVDRVNISKVTEMAKANHWQPNNPNVTNALLYTYQHNLNYKRLIQRIMMRRSARIYFPYFEPLMPNKQCYEDSMDFMDALVGGKYPTEDPNDFNFTTFWWALKMFDSFGKPSGGITKGALYYIGSYDECANVEAYIPKNITLGNIWRSEEKAFNTKFCRAKFNVSDSFVQSLNVDTRGLKLLLNWGLCVPASCHGGDIVQLINMGPLRLPVHSVSCHEDLVLEDDSSAIAAIVILSLFGAIVVVCSLIEGILASLPAPRQTGHGRINMGFISDESTIIKNGYAPKSLDVQLTSYNENPPNGYIKENGEGSYENDSIIKSNGISKAEEAGISNGTVQHYARPEPPKPPEPPTEKTRRISPFIKAFSILTNIPKLLSAKKSPSAINCIHGIRFISMLWILLGHTYNYGVISDAENPTTANLVDAASLFERFTFQGIMAAGFAVDTFFLLSGFLVTYLTLKDLGKKKVKGGYMFMYYFHRFWRLTPLYMIVLMTFSCLYAYIGEGPLWPNTIPAADYCKTNWWTNLLYVNNLVRAKEQCLGWSWYLANDMQFYVFSPIFIFLIFWFAPVGIALTVGVGVAGVASAFYAHYETGGDMFSMHETPDYWYDVYIVPWTRMAAWMVGIILGFIMYKTDKIKQLKLTTAVIGWIITLFVGFFLAYITYTFRQEDGEAWPHWVQSLYESLGRPVFASCVAWVIFACHRNRGGLINDVLSWNGIIPLSRLTYACYLLHPTVMMIKVFNQRHLIYISDFDVAYLYIGHTVMTFMVAFIFSVVFEAPFLSLEKILFHKGR